MIGTIEPTIEPPQKIKNGTLLKLGSDKYSLTIKVDKHLNWFQKKMYKICFGFTATDYTEE